MVSSHQLLADSTLFVLLLQIDRDLAETDRQKGCRHCRGRLDVANYERKPRGAPEGLPGEFTVRFSNCCSREGCRKRSTPPSCRFLGPKAYLGVIVASTMSRSFSSIMPERAVRLRTVSLFAVPSISGRGRTRTSTSSVERVTYVW